MSCRHLRMFTSTSRQNRTVGVEKNLLNIQVSVCYILKHVEDRKALSVRIYYAWCDIILIFKMHRRTRLTPRSSIHSVKIRMTSHPCNKYEQITLSYLPSVNQVTRRSTERTDHHVLLKASCCLRSLLTNGKRFLLSF